MVASYLAVVDDDVNVVVVDVGPVGCNVFTAHVMRNNGLVSWGSIKVGRSGSSGIGPR